MRTSYLIVGRLFAIIFVMLVIVGVGSQPAIQAAGKSSGVGAAQDPGIDPPEDEDALQLSAFVVMKSMSGRSYMADRESIATMPELKTQDEIVDFVSRYEPSAEDAASVRQSMQDAGLTVVAQDNLFLVVMGSLDEFQTFIPTLRPSDLSLPDQQAFIFYNNDLSRAKTESTLIDGIILSPPSHSSLSLPGSVIVNTNVKDNSNPSVFDNPYNANYADIRNALKLDRVHALGIRGQGVRIGFIDEGVFSGHQFFNEYPANISYLKFVQGQITFVGNNYNEVHDTGHGTAVASFLVNSAPQAKFYSMAIPAPEDMYPYNFIASYLVFISQHNLVDVLSLSRSLTEELPPVDEYLPEVRTGFINLISKKILVLVGGGNYGQCVEFEGIEYCSGHNAFAAIPEVIAVGGSTLVPVGSSFIFNAAEGAASFISSLFPGRLVPDIVGIYGPVWAPEKGNTSDYGSGTSYSTPQIAGMVALLKGINPEIIQANVRTILEDNSFDILDGVSGDGHLAGIGHDLATGYGQPLAHWVVQERVLLYSGWNFIGITKNYPYTAVSLLDEIYSQGGHCDYIAWWDGYYEGVMVAEDGSVYGFDFPIRPEVGYWVRCSSQIYWKQSGSDYIESVIPINIQPGLTGISIPYSNATCSASDVVHETNGLCFEVSEYDGRFRIYRSGEIDYGVDFTLDPGKGFFVTCADEATWTPNCEGGATREEEDPVPDNLFRIQSGISGEVQISIGSDASAASTMPAEACTPTNINLSNISGKTFAVSWITGDPCPGSLLVDQGEGSGFRAFDDRGMHYSGTTHHVTVRGLTPVTTYYTSIISGGETGTSIPIQTGEALAQPSTRYAATGSIWSGIANPSPNAIVYAWLRNASGEYSATLSFGLSETTEGFAISLGNARSASFDEYFDLSSATELILEVQGGSAGNWNGSVAVSLSNNPEVMIPNISLLSIPDKPAPFSPNGPVMVFSPTFGFTSSGDAAQVLQYRLELSKDNFETVESLYDQRLDPTGWSTPAYNAGQEASFQLPLALENMRGYQWRVLAYDVNLGTWSTPSKIVAFSVTRYQTYLPSTMR